jgi:hypothetical protein
MRHGAVQLAGALTVQARIIPDVALLVTETPGEAAWTRCTHCAQHA